MNAVGLDVWVVGLWAEFELGPTTATGRVIAAASDSKGNIHVYIKNGKGEVFRRPLEDLKFP